MPLPPLSRDLVRQLDRRAIDEFQIPAIVLMENAGRAAAGWMCELGIDGAVIICCGKGNNGGDGCVMARHLNAWNHEVHVLLACDPGELSGAAATNFQVVERARIPWTRWDPRSSAGTIAHLFRGAAWVVDGLLGTGIAGPVREPLASAIEQLNLAPGRKLAIDIPSGLDCDTGQPLGTAVRADFTASFVATKLGFGMPGANEFTGVVRVFEIGICRLLLQEYAV